VGALDQAEGRATVDCAPVAVEALSDEIGAEIHRRGAAEAKADDT
jgi:hypothetical protein